ncbi:MAG: 23S rRNA pseudouridine(955/2504/2580) synthase, partial [Proteobacteria bacterium]
MASAVPSVTQVRVEDNDAGQRLDNFLAARLKGVPKTRLYRIIRRGEVRVNGSRSKPATRLSPGDVVRIPPLRVADSRVTGPVPAVLSEPRAL